MHWSVRGHNDIITLGSFKLSGSFDTCMDQRRGVYVGGSNVIVVHWYRRWVFSANRGSEPHCKKDDCMLYDKHKSQQQTYNKPYVGSVAVHSV